MPTMRIACWGNFGTHNFGNESTLHAMLAAARRYLPEATLLAVCSDPADTSQRHSVAAISISPEYPFPSDRRRRSSRILRLLREVKDWARVFRAMRSIGLLAITGTGVLTDANDNLLGVPYQMFKWVAAAWICRRRIAFVSVGAESMRRPVHRLLIGLALRLADYRSFRDPISRQRATRLMRSAENDPIFPDLAFSLPRPLLVARDRPVGVPPTVAVGIYAVEQGPQALERYVETIGDFVIWLLHHGYPTRIVIGDAAYDQEVRARLQHWLRAKNVLHRVIDQPIASFEELLGQFADVDLVVATRFHNLLLALLLAKPALSVSHMDKNDQLMATMGLDAHCVPIEGLDMTALTAHFRALEQEAPRLRAQIREKLEHHRERLEAQYAALFGSPAGVAAVREIR